MNRDLSSENRWQRKQLIYGKHRKLTILYSNLTQLKLDEQDRHPWKRELAERILGIGAKSPW
jgi:hypothetical protein